MSCFLLLKLFLILETKIKEMRDKNRIPKILTELQRIWEAHPDLRLGQLLVIAANPPDPCPAVFYIEDEELLQGLLAFDNQVGQKSEESKETLYWKKYPDISRIPLEELTLDLVEEMIHAIKKHKNSVVITPIHLMKLNGVRVADNQWILSQKLRRKKLKLLLAQLAEKGILEEREWKQDFKGMKEVGYNLKNE